MFQVGDRIGDYKIAARLRAGGMATLFLGQRSGAAGFSKYVAIKVIHQHLAEEGNFVQMFVDEAHLASRIQHPNVVHVETFGEAAGAHFLVMEYVHGCSLSALLRVLRRRGRRLSPAVAVAIAAWVAEGLQAAHEVHDDEGRSLGVVHRDISPQNVLLAYAGYVKLIDFGIAKMAGRTHSTASGSIKGKFRYMSPEQASGAPLDLRSDIYSLGIVLWEMLTGRRLFDAETDVQVLDLVRTPTVTPPSALVPGLSVALDAAVCRALSPKADDRHDSVASLRADLLAAVPESSRIDSRELSDLLVTLMAESIELDRKELPANVMSSIGVRASLRPGQPEVLAKATVALDDDLAQAAANDSHPREVTGDLSSEASPAAVARSVTVVRAAEARRMRGVIGAVAACGVVGLGAWFAFRDARGHVSTAATPRPGALVETVRPKEMAAVQHAAVLATVDAGGVPIADASAALDSGAVVQQPATDHRGIGAKLPSKGRTGRRERSGSGIAGDRAREPLLVDDVF